MSTRNLDQPIEHDEYEDELPYEALIFTSPEFDRDEEKARDAGDAIYGILRDLVSRFVELEDIARALRESEPTSDRARQARAEVLRAIDGFNEVIGGVSNAKDAFTHRW